MAATTACVWVWLPGATDLGPLDYLLGSGSDRIGALDIRATLYDL